MKITKIAKADLMANEWDGGKTYEYFIYPPQTNYAERNFLFRISSASIDKVPSQFTRFENYKRYLVMLDNSLEIIRNGSTERYEKHELFTFDSNDTITSSSVGNDFNLMVQKDVESELLLVKEKSTNARYIALFALQSVEMSIDKERLELETYDLILIENTDRQSIEITSSEILLCISIEIEKVK